MSSHERRMVQLIQVLWKLCHWVLSRLCIVLQAGGSDTVHWSREQVALLHTPHSGLPFLSKCSHVPGLTYLSHGLVSLRPGLMAFGFFRVYS